MNGRVNALISVIVPIYNVKRYLRRCVDSILSQTYQKIEIILVNDGSMDESKEICNEYENKDERVKVIHKENGGLSTARNAGLKVAIGDYIGFVDADDYIEPDMYKHLIDEMTNNIDVVTCGVCHEFEYKYRRITNTDQGNNLRSGEMGGEEAIREFLLMRKIDLSVCNKLFRRSVFDNIQFPVDKSSEDVPVMWHIVTHYNIFNNGFNDYHYFHRAGSITSEDFSSKRMDFYEYAKNIYNDIKMCFPNLKSEAKTFVIRVILGVLHQIRNSENRISHMNDYLYLKNELLLYDGFIKTNKMLNKYEKNEAISVINDNGIDLLKFDKVNEPANKLGFFYETLLQWNSNNFNKKYLTEILIKDGVKTIAIYGMKEFGELLMLELENSTIEIAYIIDKNKDNINTGYPMYYPDDDYPYADAVVVTAVYYYKEIYNYLKSTNKFGRIYDLNELVFSTT